MSRLFKVNQHLNLSERGSVLLFFLIGIIVLIIMAGGGYFFFKSSVRPPKGAVEPSGKNTDFNVLIVGWDGISWDAFNACFNREQPECSTGLPNIKELSGEGKRIFLNVTSNGETQTTTGWPQILTGYNSGYTKIIDRKNFQPVPKGGTILEKLKKGLGEDMIATIYIGVRDTIVSSCKGEQLAGRTSFDDEGEAAGDVTKTETNIVDEQGGPWCNMKSAIDLFVNDPIRNKGTGARALEALEQYKNKRFVMFTLFADADDAGHKKGGASSEYTKGLVDDDVWLGKLMEKLKELKIDQKTYIYVISDHGWDSEKRASTPTDKQGADDHDNAPFGIFATNDNSIIRSGDRRDLAPTILKKYGVSLGEDTVLNLAAIQGFPLDVPLPFTTVPKGGVYIKDNGLKCTSDTTVVPFSKFIQQRAGCLDPQGGKNIVAGFCTPCSDGVCEFPENQCNCPIDCK